MTVSAIPTYSRIQETMTAARASGDSDGMAGNIAKRRGPRHRPSGQSSQDPSGHVRVSARRRGSLIDRPYVRVTETGCWLWVRGKDTSGYGRLWSKGRLCPAHRVTYEGLREPIPSGLNLDHLCGMRACVNPDHLEVVTQATNIRRSSVAKLTPSVVQEIRRSYANGDVSFAELGRRYGVSDRNIIAVIRHETWSEVNHVA